MKANSMGMLWMIPAAWRNALLRAASWTLEALPERRMTHGMNIYTLLDDATRGFGGAAEEGWGGERRRLFGLGEGPAEAVAEAKEESGDRCLSGTCESGRVGQKWVSRHVLATCH